MHRLMTGQHLAIIRIHGSLFNIDKNVLLVRRSSIDDAVQKIVPPSMLSTILHLARFLHLLVTQETAENMIRLKENKIDTTCRRIHIIQSDIALVAHKWVLVLSRNVSYICYR